MHRIREYQSRDQERLADCMLELQIVEHALEPDRVDGVSIVTRNLEDLLTIVRQNRGQIFVAEVHEEVVRFVCVRLELDNEVYISTLTDDAYISDLVVLPSHLFKTQLCQKLASPLCHVARIGASSTSLRNLWDRRGPA